MSEQKKFIGYQKPQEGLALHAEWKVAEIKNSEDETAFKNSVPQGVTHTIKTSAADEREATIKFQKATAARGAQERKDAEPYTYIAKVAASYILNNKN